MLPTGADYDRHWQTRYDMYESIRRWQQGQTQIDYSCNGPLEHGVRLENIDADFELQETIPIWTEKPNESWTEQPFIVLYASGSCSDPLVQAQGVWSPSSFARLARIVHRRIESVIRKKVTVLIIGAGFDARSADEMYALLTDSKSPVTCVKRIDMPAVNVTWALAHCMFMVGYQSGLSIIADQFDTPQYMVYFERFDRLRNAWPKKRNIEGNIYTSGLFSEAPDAAFNRLNHVWINNLRGL